MAPYNRDQLPDLLCSILCPGGAPVAHEFSSLKLKSEMGVERLIEDLHITRFDIQIFPTNLSSLMLSAEQAGAARAVIRRKSLKCLFAACAPLNATSWLILQTYSEFSRLAKWYITGLILFR